MELSQRKKRFLVLGAGLLIVIVGALSLLHWNMLRHPLERLASARTGREVSIAGNLSGHLWSKTPGIALEGLKVANPAWDAQRPMLAVERLAIEVELSQLLRGHLVLHRVEILHPQLYLHREKSGRANWTFADTAPSDAPAAGPAKFPAVRDLTIEAGTLQVLDEIRHLKVSGTIVAHEAEGAKASRAFEVRTEGTINNEPFRCSIEGGPLLELTPGSPYPFHLTVKAGSNDIAADGRVLKPFDLGGLDLDLSASGKDLAELYYLTQVTLPNSPPYKFQAHVQRDGLKVSVTDIKGQYGQSDMRGTVDIDASRKRMYLKAALVSKHLFMDDFVAVTGTKTGTSAKSLDEHAPAAPAGTAAKPPVATTFFPTARLQADRLRAMDADVQLRATSIEAGKVPFTEVLLHAQLKDGQLLLDPLNFLLPQGNVLATIRLDARSHVPKVHIDGRMTDIQLAQLKGKGNAAPPVQGSLQARAVLDGTGDSVHAVMADADGSATVVLPEGQIRAALPELTGIDVPEGVLLLLGKSNETAQVRCGVVHFDVHDGHANATNFVIDTQNVLITGHGGIDLGSEALDLTVQGHPKKLRLLRVRSPVEVRGTLSRPAIRLEAGSLARQGGVAVALGALLTPLASLLAFVDPGLAKDQNCVQLLGSASNDPKAPVDADPKQTSSGPK